MKRYGYLYPEIVDFPNILSAARKAQKCKRFRDDVLLFNYDLEKNLGIIQNELINKTYIPGDYKTFVIYEPKRRLISAAPYKDRVVHHALCNVITPIFERSLIDSTYANRVGKGTHKALDHFVKLAKKYKYILSADIEKYFPSMDHVILKEKIRRKIKCPDTLWLIETILDNSNKQEPVIHYFPGDNLFSPHERRRGLPIGNLTSQLWANVYLSDFDHYITEKYGGKRYVRYVDDIAIFSNDREELIECLNDIEHYLQRIRLKPHPVKTQIFEVKNGANFLGFRILPDRIRVRQENLRRARRRLSQMQMDYRHGKISVEKIRQSIESWIAHLSYGDTWRLREKVFSSLVFTRN